MIGNLKNLLAQYYLPVVEPPYYTYLSKKADYIHKSQNIDRIRKKEAPSHILLLVIDALRPDYTPDIGMEFSKAITPGTWTMPAVTSIHTGLYPHQHHATTHTDNQSFSEQASPDITLPHVAEAAGYKTFCACAFFNPFFAVQGWFQKHRVFSDANAEKVANSYLDWLSQKDRTFGYLHFGDLHEPIAPPAKYIEANNVDMTLNGLGTTSRFKKNFDENKPECRAFRENQLRLYEAALEYLEDTLRRIINNIPEDTLLIVTGDHGEAYWEHTSIDRAFSDPGDHCGLGHGGTPFDMVARVPLAISQPNVNFNGGWPSLRDIPQTIAFEIIRDSCFDGHPWQEPIEKDRIVICESTRHGVERKAAYKNDLKIIRSEEDDITFSARIRGNSEIFSDISPDEKQQLLDALPNDWDISANSADTNQIVTERLKHLGYK